jgi:hypothetical protein
MATGMDMAVSITSVKSSVLTRELASTGRISEVKIMAPTIPITESTAQIMSARRR